MDVVALAQTGTGKTAAFGLPLLERIDPDRKSRARPWCSPPPASSACRSPDLGRYAKHLPGVKRVAAVYGGANIREQIRDIQRGANIVVATPGRLIDLLDREAVDLATVRTAVLDEADEMLNMGFQEDLTTILENTRRRTSAPGSSAPP
jgi:ATP-dependent RNA helicase DeaD